MASITFGSIGKVYPDGTRAIHDVNIHVEDGEFVVLVGPSGCGKSTALGGASNIAQTEVRDGRVLVRLRDASLLQIDALRHAGLRAVAQPTADTVHLLHADPDGVHAAIA
jgi:ABC-type sugar transport system ATPase subunit